MKPGSGLSPVIDECEECHQRRPLYSIYIPGRGTIEVCITCLRKLEKEQQQPDQGKK